MSGIAGILSFGQRPPDQLEIVAEMSDALAGHGPDGVRVASHQGAAMAYRALNAGCESRLARQPLLSDDLLVAWDGRLDNREDLQRRLGVAAGKPDVELVIAAYRRWGEGFLAVVVGSFAVALWDARRQRLYLARDPLPGRPLFFAVLPDQILWASTIRALLATSQLSSDVDDDWVGAFIVGAEPVDRSPFKAVQVVTPGEAVVFTPDGKRRWRFWAPVVGRTIRYPKDADYEHAFRELFVDAVRCCLRADGCVFAELSGGVDSSSVVCVADRLLTRGGTEATDLHTLSWVYDRAGSADEREFITIVEEFTRRRACHILEDDYPVLAGFEQGRPEVPGGYQLWPVGRQRSIEIMREHDACVLLSGFAGDHLLWSQMGIPFQLADDALRLRPIRLLRELGRWHRGAGLPYPLLWSDGVVKPLWWAMRRRGPGVLEFGFSWLGEKLRSRMANYAASRLNWCPGFALPSDRMRVDALSQAVSGQSWLYDEREQGIETRYPFLDRRLVEFCLAIPFDQLARSHQMRSLHRRALEGILPEVIRHRTSKRGPDEAIMRGVRREWPVIEALFADRNARVYERGHIHRDRFLNELQRIRHGLYGDQTMVLRTLQMEVWLRSLEKRRA